MPSRLFPANTPIPPRPAGWQFTHAGIVYGFSNFVVLSGTATVADALDDQPATLQVTPSDLNVVSGTAQVVSSDTLHLRLTDYQFTFSYEWAGQPVTIGANQLTVATVCAWLDAQAKSYEFSAIWNGLDLASLAKTAGVASFPPIGQWTQLATYSPRVASLAPNPLNATQAKTDAALPQLHTMAGLLSPDKNFILSISLYVAHSAALGVVNLMNWSTFPQGQSKFITGVDVSSQLASPRYYGYLGLWPSFQNANTLPIVNASINTASHTMVSGSAASGPWNLINPREPFAFADHQLIPIEYHWGTLPMARPTVAADTTPKSGSDSANGH